MCEFITKCYGMGLEGRGVTMVVRHKAERGPDVDGWDLTLAIDCTKEQHKLLQELIVLNLAKAARQTSLTSVRELRAVRAGTSACT
jgi:hypothetical protein